MRYQTYVLHLIDGTAIPMAEDYDLPISPRAALFTWKPAK